jgi:hypothetical protein
MADSQSALKFLQGRPVVLARALIERCEAGFMRTHRLDTGAPTEANN